MKRKIISTLFALVLAVSLCTVMAVPAAAASYPQFLDVVPYDVTTGEWSTTVEETTPQSGTHSYHVVLPTDAALAGLDIIHKYIYGPTGVGTMTLADITDMTFWEYVKVAGGTMQMGAGITLYMDINEDGDFDFTNDAQIILESPYPDDPLVLDNIGKWALRDITDFAGIQKGGGRPEGEDEYTGVGGVALHCTLAEWQASEYYADEVVLWVGIVAGWGDYGDYDGYFDDFIINGETYDLEPAVINTDTSEGFNTIQDAIDDVDTVGGHTINVTDGTYYENIVVDKSLTIQAASSPVIDGGGNLGPGVHITAANVTFQGFTITNFTCTPTSGIGAILVEGDGAKIDDNTIYDITTTDGPAGIGIDVHASNVEVTNNTVHDVGSIGIRVRHDWDTAPTVSNNVLLENNEVYKTANSGVLVTGYAKGVTVRQNEIYESLEPTEYSLFVHYGAEDVLIENNIIRDPYDSIYGHNVVLAGCDNVTISGNAITGATSGKNIYILSDYAPWVDSEMLSTNVTITNNDIQNGKWGVRISNAGATDASDMAATTTINFNNISGNTEYGVENAIATSVDAENNWWGNASGPLYASALYDIAYGDDVSDYVDYQPWLLAVVVTGVTPTTYDKTLALKDNWTLVSVDKEVKAGTAWVGTTVLAGTDTILAYQYTPGSGFPQVTMATQLTSVDAYYIKTDGGGGVGINYSTSSPGVVTKTLVAGWNIISCAGETDAYTLLSQLRHVQIGEEGTGLTSLVGQGSYNQFTDSISKTLVTDNEWLAITPTYTQLPLSAFDGFWVYMNAGKSFGVIPD